jgi:hypothetical protein
VFQDQNGGGAFARRYWQVKVNFISILVGAAFRLPPCVCPPLSTDFLGLLSTYVRERVLGAVVSQLPEELGEPVLPKAVESL